MKIFPFYVVIDVSMSMRNSISALNEELPSLKEAVDEDPIVGELARFGLITFSDYAYQELPLSDLADVEVMPTLTASGSTSYARAFELLHEVLPHDMEWFKGEGWRPYRPAVFFITDGKPNDGDPWREWLAEITRPEFVYRPNIVAFGFGQVDEATLASVATYKAYAAEKGQGPATVLRTITDVLTESIINSSNQAMSGQSSLMLPKSIDGMYEIDLDLV